MKCPICRKEIFSVDGYSTIYRCPYCNEYLIQD